MSRVNCKTALHANALALCLQDEGYNALWFVTGPGRVTVITNADVDTLAHAVSFAGGL